MVRPQTFWASERGSALPIVLVFVVVVSVIVGLVLLAQALQQRFVQRDVHRLQARYAAEAGVYRALADLDGSLQALSATYEVKGAERCSVWVEPFGGFARVFAEATVRDEQISLRALAGMRPPSDFERALVLEDRRSSLTLTGATRITGPITVGPRGINRERLDGTPFTGELAGEVHRTEEVRVPAYDTSAYQQTIQRAEHLIGVLPSRREARGSAEDATRIPMNDPPTPLATRGRTIHSVQGDLTLTPDDSLAQGPIMVVATGRLVLKGDLTFSSGSIFLAGSTLEVEGAGTGQEGVFYGRDTLRMRQDAQMAGQFLSKGEVAVQDRVHLQYPSVVYASRAEGRIQLSDQAQVDGLVLFPSRPPQQAGGEREVVVESNTRLRGALYNRARTELWGQVHGSVFTYQFGFYRSPTHYVNWLKDATLHRPERPAGFVVPFGFEDAERPAVIRWDTPSAHAEELSAPPA